MASYKLTKLEYLKKVKEALFFGQVCLERGALKAAESFLKDAKKYLKLAKEAIG